jgi:hypothetical protein
MALLGKFLFDSFPEFFLPLYKTIKPQYDDFQANPNLRRLVNDSRAAITHLGWYLGFLIAEIGRRDWKNVTLISTVGLVNGLGWSLCQNWKWAPALWPNTNFNWWRCWESSGGISIGLAYGLAYYLVNRRMSPEEQSALGARFDVDCPNLERLGAYVGLVLGLGLSIRNGLKGWANIYLGNEQRWDHVLWLVVGPVLLATLLGVITWVRLRPLPDGFQGDAFPHAYRLIWLVLIVQNLIAQLVTGPHSVWNETIFSIYYVLLFLLSAVIVLHHHCWTARRISAP